MLVDSHCHLDFEALAGDRAGVLARARSAGVGAMLTIGTHRANHQTVKDIADSQDNIWCSVGIHPHEADTDSLRADEIVALARHPKVVGIGETGLDFYYDKSPRDVQESQFRAHIEAARQAGLPVVIHTRDADHEMAEILTDEMGKGAFCGLLHCFSSSRALADTALNLGLYLSISGIVTFKNADDLRDIVKHAPLDRLLVETDAPYLAPAPMRGKRNEPAFTRHTAEKVAEIKELSLEKVAAVTTDNYFSLFSKAKRS